MGDWLTFFRELTTALEPVAGLFGQAEGRAELGVGAGGDMTCKIDRFAEGIILRALEDRHHHTGEGYSVLSEEEGSLCFGHGDLLVLVDPVDGSINAKRGVPFYAATLAVAAGDRYEDLLVGYTVNFATGETFFAQRPSPGGDIETFHNFKPFHPPQDLPPDSLELLAMEMPDHFEELAQHQPLLRAFHRTRLLGAMALDLCYVGAGALDAFFHPKPSRPIDFAGASLFVTGAGGVVCAPGGGPVQADLASLGRGPKLMAFRTPQIRDRELGLMAEKR